jgi:signal peptidase I
MANPAPQPENPNPTPPAPISPWRRLAQMFVLFLSGFLFIRSLIIEPFGVPTGSMAPVLYGNHRTADCPRCGFPVTVGEPGPDARPVKFDACRCPNCQRPMDLSTAREIHGDRLIVDKNLYHARSPRRWEPAVFKCPADNFKPYVKRVIGLPGERIQIAGGDVYANGELLRKTLTQCLETRVLVFDMNYAPAEGWNVRWLEERMPTDPKLPATTKRQDKIASEDVCSNHSLRLKAFGQPQPAGVTYRHYQLDKKAEEPIDDFLGYNGQPPERRFFGKAAGSPWGDPVHDFLIEFDVTVNAASQGHFAARLVENVESVTFRIPLGTSAGTVCVEQDGLRGGQSAPLAPWQAQETHHVIFAFVDRRVMLSIDGREVVKPLDLPADPVTAPRERRANRPVQFGVEGADVTLENFRLYRDIHYLPGTKGTLGWALGPKDYFLLGDNTSSSHDSRVWEIREQAAPGVPEYEFVGKPFLIHQPMKPSRVTWNGTERMIQSPDWDRIRRLR